MDIRNYLKFFLKLLALYYIFCYNAFMENTIKTNKLIKKVCNNIMSLQKMLMALTTIVCSTTAYVEATTGNRIMGIKVYPCDPTRWETPVQGQLFKLSDSVSVVNFQDLIKRVFHSSCPMLNIESYVLKILLKDEHGDYSGPKYVPLAEINLVDIQSIFCYPGTSIDFFLKQGRIVIFPRANSSLPAAETDVGSDFDSVPDASSWYQWEGKNQSLPGTELEEVVE